MRPRFGIDRDPAIGIGNFERAAKVGKLVGGTAEVQIGVTGTDDTTMMTIIEDHTVTDIDPLGAMVDSYNRPTSKR